MPLIVGNLLLDPVATSFISLDEAESYLTEEGNEVWGSHDIDTQEAKLVQASRWLLYNLTWAPLVWTPGDLVRVGHAAARLAAEALEVNLFPRQDTAGGIKRERVGPIETEYFSAATGDAGNVSFPWLRPMLGRLIAGGTGRTGTFTLMRA